MFGKYGYLIVVVWESLSRDFVEDSRQACYIAKAILLKLNKI